MKSRDPPRAEDRGSVIQFRPRPPRGRNDSSRWPDLRRPPVDDLAKYERDRESEGYRQRMMNNLLAFGVLCFIVYCGIWLTSTMAQLRKDQDCVLSGRTNCSPIRVPVEPR